MKGEKATGHRPDIQGLRAVAVIIVVLYHARVPGFSGGFVGVDVFFVISGYVIGASLLRELTATGTIRLRRFYERRVRRLLPAYAVAALCTLVIAMLFMPIGRGQTNTAETALAATFSVSNLYLMRTGGRYFAPTGDDNPFLHTWSLGVEEQFYLVLPALIALTLVVVRKSDSQRRIAVVGLLAVLTAASFTFSVRMTTADPLVGFYHPGSRFWEIGVGMLLAFAPAVSGVRRVFADVACSASGVAICVTTLMYSDATEFPGLAALAPVAATAALVSFLPMSRLARPAGSSVAGWIGDRSYGWYLWHWPLIVFADSIFSPSWPQLLACAMLALVPTWLSYRYVEQPVRERRVRLSGRRLPLAAGGIAVFLTAVSGASAAGAARRWGIDSYVFEPDGLARELGCDTIYEPDPSGCTIERDGPSRLMLVGDSHAQAAARGVNAAAEQIGASLTIYTYASCTAFDHPFHEADCEEYRSAIWQLIDVVQPTHLIVGQFSLGRLNETRYDAQLWWDGLVELEERLDARDIDLVVLGDVPEYESVTSRRQSLLEPNAVAATQTRDTFERDRESIAALERTIADAWLDPIDATCDARSCSTRRDTVWLYYDGDHLNDAGSLRLGRAVTEQLRVIAG